MVIVKNSFDVVFCIFLREICFIDVQINSFFDVCLNFGLIFVNLYCNEILVIENFDKFKYFKYFDLLFNYILRM